MLNTGSVELPKHHVGGGLGSGEGEELGTERTLFSQLLSHTSNTPILPCVSEACLHTDEVCTL